MIDKLKGVVGGIRLTAKQKEPELFLVGGIGLGIFAAVQLARAHKDAEEALDEVRGEIAAVSNYIDGLDEEEENPTTRFDRQKILFPLYVETARRSAIIYGPSVLMGVGALALIVTSHRSMKARNRALMGMAAVLERSFNKYRERVRDELGEEADERFYYGAESRKINVLDESGKKTKKKESKNHQPEEFSPIMYQRRFDEYNVNWDENDDMNLWWLDLAQQHFTLQLQSHGWVSLNEVYKYLGFKRTGWGQAVGWLRDEGDGFVDFGLDADINQRPEEREFLLDFNVSGYMLDTLDEE